MQVWYKLARGPGRGLYRHQATHRDVSHTRLFRRRAQPQRCRLIVIPGNQKNDEDSDRLLPLIQVSRTENKLALEFREL